MRLSVIIPVYKSEKYIRHTLQSIFGQAFDRSAVEVIVVNDGTPDNSMEIVREFAAREPGIQIIEQENRGLSAARNAGLVRATGKYIWFVDSDDWIEDGFLEKALPLIREDDTDVFLFRIREHRESDGKIVLERKLLGNEIRETDFLELLQAKIDFTPVQLFLIRKELMDAHQLKFVEGIVHDGKMDIRIVGGGLQYSVRGRESDSPAKRIAVIDQGLEVGREIAALLGLDITDLRVRFFPEFLQALPGALVEGLVIDPASISDHGDLPACAVHVLYIQIHSGRPCATHAACPAAGQFARADEPARGKHQRDAQAECLVGYLSE